MATLPEKICEALSFESYDSLILCDKNQMKLVGMLSHDLCDLYKEKGKCQETLEMAAICLYTFDDEKMSLAIRIFIHNNMTLLNYENFPYFRKVVNHLSPPTSQAIILMKP